MKDRPNGPQVEWATVLHRLRAPTFELCTILYKEPKPSPSEVILWLCASNGYRCYSSFPTDLWSIENFQGY